MDIRQFLKKSEPWQGLILILICSLLLFKTFQYISLQGEIKDSCGYERGERIYCVCDKSVVQYYDLQNNPYYTGKDLNFSDEGEWD